MARYEKQIRETLKRYQELYLEPQVTQKVTQSLTGGLEHILREVFQGVAQESSPAEEGKDGDIFFINGS